VFWAVPTNQNPNTQLTSNQALMPIEVDVCLTIVNKTLAQTKTTVPNRSANDLSARVWQRGSHYDADELGTFVKTNLLKLVPGDARNYEIKRWFVFSRRASGGTGKTLIVSPISTTIIGTLIILTTNLKASKLRNGVRLRVCTTHQRVNETEFPTGSVQDQVVLYIHL